MTDTPALVRKHKREYVCVKACYREVHAFSHVFSWCARFSWNGRRVIRARTALEQERNRLADGIMRCIDASWHSTDARDWSRPELILAEYVGDLCQQIEQYDEALKRAEAAEQEREKLKQERDEAIFNQNRNAANAVVACEQLKGQLEAAEQALAQLRSALEQIDDILWNRLETFDPGDESGDSLITSEGYQLLFEADNSAANIARKALADHPPEPEKR